MAFCKIHGQWKENVNGGTFSVGRSSNNVAKLNVIVKDKKELKTKFKAA